MPSLQPAHSTRKREHELSPDEAERRRRNQFLKKREIAARLGIGRDMVEELWNSGKLRKRSLGPRINGSTQGDLDDCIEASIVT
jgi:DNA-binding transcriptional regulator YiaG